MPATYDLRGKIALVTWAAGGIGRATYRLLAESGAAMHAWDLFDPSEFGSFAKVDVTEPLGVKAAAERLIAEAGQLDILVHCAGYLGRAQPFPAHDRADWSRIVHVNLI